jgi:hypothetical protein
MLRERERYHPDISLHIITGRAERAAASAGRDNNGIHPARGAPAASAAAPPMQSVDDAQILSP